MFFLERSADSHSFFIMHWQKCVVKTYFSPKNNLNSWYWVDYHVTSLSFWRLVCLTLMKWLNSTTMRFPSQPVWAARGRETDRRTERWRQIVWEAEKQRVCETGKQSWRTSNSVRVRRTAWEIQTVSERNRQGERESPWGKRCKVNSENSATLQPFPAGHWKLHPSWVISRPRFLEKPLWTYRRFLLRYVGFRWDGAQ